MDVIYKHKPSYGIAIVTLAPNETIEAEPGSMVSHTSGIQVDTTMKGGLMGGFKRMLGGENFFQNQYTAPSNGGEMMFAPALPGDMMTIEVQAGNDFLLQSGAYVVSETSVEVDSTWGGSKGFFGSGSLIMLKLSGAGKVIASAYGAIEERQLAAGETYIVDTGHLVGLDAGVQFTLKKAGSWKSTILGGEGMIAELQGPGRILIQTRSEEALIGWIIPKVPQKSS